MYKNRDTNLIFQAMFLAFLMIFTLEKGNAQINSAAEYSIVGEVYKSHYRYFSEKNGQKISTSDTNQLLLTRLKTMEFKDRYLQNIIDVFIDADGNRDSFHYQCFYELNKPTHIVATKNGLPHQKNEFEIINDTFYKIHINFENGRKEIRHCILNKSYRDIAGSLWELDSMTQSLKPIYEYTTVLKKDVMVTKVIYKGSNNSYKKSAYFLQRDSLGNPILVLEDTPEFDFGNLIYRRIEYF